MKRNTCPSQRNGDRGSNPASSIIPDDVPPAIEILQKELTELESTLKGKQFVIEKQQEILAHSIFAHRQMVKRKNEVKKSIDILVKLKEITNNERRNREENQ